MGKPITMHVPMLCDWFSSSAFACDSDDPVFTCKRRSRKRYQNAVFISSSSSTLLITTPTPSLVKTSLKPLPYLAVDHVPENSTTMSTNFLTRLIAKKKCIPPTSVHQHY